MPKKVVKEGTIEEKNTVSSSKKSNTKLEKSTKEKTASKKVASKPTKLVDKKGSSVSPKKDSDKIVSVASKKASTKKTANTKTTSATKKAVTSKISATDKKTSTSKTASNKSSATAKKATSTTTKKAAAKKVTSTTKKTTTKATTTKKSNTKTSSTKGGTKRKTVATAKPMLAEYYDLPYRYNQTIVKILAQTPTTLFVYWDISDEDRSTLVNMHGDNFFNETRPVLIVHNTTKNYSFEIDINDFANSWYIRTQEPNCDYVIELGRRFNRFSGEYVFINSSNDIVSPNDHILFENINLGNVLFKNVKSNKLSSKDFGDLRFINNIDKLYGNIYDVYSSLYDDETLNGFSNPSSGEFILNK